MSMTREEVDDFVARIGEYLYKRGVPTFSVNTTVNRGTCAGSVTYAIRPERTADIWEVMERVIGAYKAHGMMIDPYSKEGAEMFFQVFLDAVKVFNSENIEVNISDRVIFGPRLYKDGSGAYINIHGCSKEYNRLPNQIELDQSPAFLRAKKAKARAQPYDVPELSSKTKKVGRVTRVRCPNCGYDVVIEDTQND